MKKYLFLIAYFAMTSFCYAQNFKEYSLSSNGSMRYIELESSEKSYTLTNSSTIFSSLLKISADDSFVLYKQEIDKLGITHHHYQQYYQGGRWLLLVTWHSTDFNAFEWRLSKNSFCSY